MKMLIVESGAKARTIQKYLGKDWKVLACGGHVQGLPSEGKQGRKAYWSNRSGELPAPPWEWTDRGEGAVDKIFEAADKNEISEFYLAADPDREGEFIAWRLAELLKSRGKTHRVTFDEVTKPAIEAAIATPRAIDMKMVDSARVRRFLDRLVGFRTSKLARTWLKGKGGASMGRVQTPTLGFIVERELEREAHVPIPYFEVRAAAAGIDLQVRFAEPSDDDVWRDDNDKPHPTRTSDEDAAVGAEASIRKAGKLAVTEAKPSKPTTGPKPPFTTDALLQDAGNRWGWSPGKTMKVASTLYEAGHITYLRTDSTRLGDDALAAARATVEKVFSADHLGEGVTGKKSGSKVQDAHEAIRPTRMEVAEPTEIESDAVRLYTLIRARTLASQMARARYARISLRAAAEGLEAPLTGSVRWRTFDGWEAAYAALDKAPPVEPPVPNLDVGATLVLDPEAEDAPNPKLVRDQTRPPGRYRAHTVIKRMKESGIGRPSTYAKTVEKLTDRNYVIIEDGALMPTPRGRAAWLDVAPLYEDDDADNDLFSVDFTAEMEDVLDEIEGGEAPAPPVWEKYRDHVRRLHELARERRNEGQVTPRKLDQLQRLVDNAPADFEVPDDLASLAHSDAAALVRSLRERGIEGRPSENQLDYIRSLIEKGRMTEAEAAELIELDSLDQIKRSSKASELIDILREKTAGSEKPASPKQLGVIKKNAKLLGLSDADAVALVGAKSFDELTGGWKGTASQLIDALMERKRAAKKK